MSLVAFIGYISHIAQVIRPETIIECAKRDDVHVTTRAYIGDYIAERSLSLNVNDPTTAVQAIDRIYGLLRRLGNRRMTPTLHRDSDGTERVTTLVAQCDDLIHLAFDEVRQYGSGSVQVLRRLVAALEDLIGAVPSERRPPLHVQLQLVGAAAVRNFPDHLDQAFASEPDRQGIGTTSARDRHAER